MYKMMYVSLKLVNELLTIITKPAISSSDGLPKGLGIHSLAFVEKMKTNFSRTVMLIGIVVPFS